MVGGKRGGNGLKRVFSPVFEHLCKSVYSPGHAPQHLAVMVRRSGFFLFIFCFFHYFILSDDFFLSDQGKFGCI